MQAKYAVALILALQVSMSLCEIPTPSAELVAKYDKLRTTIYAHLLKLRDQYKDMIDTAGNSEHGQTATAMVENLQGNPEFQEAVKGVFALMEEAKPKIDVARTAMLGLYEHYLRPYIGEYLDRLINSQVQAVPPQ